MSSSANDLAARRALISAGIVGLGTIGLTQLLDVETKLALGTSLAGALALDFVVNKEEIERAIQVAKTHIGESIKRGSAQGDSQYNMALVAGVTALLAGATMQIGYVMRDTGTRLVDPLHPVGVGTGIVGSGLTMLVNGWTVVDRLMFSRDCGRAIGTALNRIAGAAAGAYDSTLRLFARDYHQMPPQAQQLFIEEVQQDIQLNQWDGAQPHILLRNNEVLPNVVEEPEEIVILEDDHQNRVAVNLGRAAELDAIPIVRAPQRVLDQVADILLTPDPRRPLSRLPNTVPNTPDTGVGSISVVTSPDRPTTMTPGGEVYTDSVYSESVGDDDVSPEIWEQLVQERWRLDPGQMDMILGNYPAVFQYRGYADEDGFQSLVGFKPGDANGFNALFFDPGAETPGGRFYWQKLRFAQLRDFEMADAPPTAPPAGDMVRLSQDVEIDVDFLPGGSTDMEADVALGKIIRLSEGGSAALVGLANSEDVVMIPTQYLMPI